MPSNYWGVKMNSLRVMGKYRYVMLGDIEEIIARNKELGTVLDTIQEML